MESKANKNSHVLMFGLSFNLILTLGSLGFSCYSLHRLDSRLTALEQNSLLKNSPYHISNPFSGAPGSAHFRPSGSLEKETGRVQRAAERPSMCGKCSSVCENLNSQRSNWTVERNQGNVVCVQGAPGSPGLSGRTSPDIPNYSGRGQLELPRFISKLPPAITVKETQNVLIHCKATGFPQPVITWYKNGHLKEKERKYFGERSLKLEKIQFQDRGVYTCTAENLMGRVELSVNVSVKVPAKFITEPKRSVTAYKTWDTVLQCNIFGFPSPVVTWTRSGEQLPVNRHFINGSQLTIQNTTEDDDGAYVCQGTNQMANVTRVIWVVVKVVVNPYIASSPPNEIQVQHVGDTVKLNCSAGGSPLPKVTWFKNGRSVFSRAAGDGNGLIKSEMVIHRFKAGDSGIYTCLFYNGKNMTAESNTSLTLVNCGDPGVLSNGRRHGARYWTGEAVSFVCDPEYHLTGPATRVCLASGNWTGVQPSCRRICQSLESPEHGFIHGQQFWEGEHVSFSCRSAYWLEGSLERRCLKNGTWTGNQPKCILLGLKMPSNIIADHVMILSLLRFLEPNPGSHKRWTLCYRASSYGWAASTFHSHCDGKPHTVTIIRKGPYVFGGYTDIAWGSSGGYSYSSSAFIFSLINKEGLAPFKSMVKIPKYAIYKARSFGPIFGGGNDILISDNANINIYSYTNFNGRYYSVPSRVHNSRTILAGSYYFTPDEVEVFILYESRVIETA